MVEKSCGNLKEEGRHYKALATPIKIKKPGLFYQPSFSTIINYRFPDVHLTYESEKTVKF